MSQPSLAGPAARLAAVREAATRPVPTPSAGSSSPSRAFGTLTFSTREQQAHLPDDVFRRLQEAVRRDGRLDPATAAAVAHGMKEWAVALGATHFCHWFQPQTGLTAEKHDSFLAFDSHGMPMERLSGRQLVQGEPDASSFPSGGARSTFEARGYTTWDPTSPVFLTGDPTSRTLCIPSHFVSYDGHALDEKTPLLRSSEVLAAAAREALGLLESPAARVTATVGVEQEYFLVDHALAALRPDLVLCGRTLLGARPAKGQELEDHYFGTIKERVLGFMQELDRELMQLGVPIKTRHNEVAPMQFEFAPIFEEAPHAADHNQVVMAQARALARRHGFVLLLHEKPFAGVNGSGKHVNWSLQTADGENLLEPGDTPSRNLRFLFFLCAFLEGIRLRGPLLRATVASASNDHRLGANEAPPAIMSVYVGDQLSDVLDDLARRRAPRGASRSPTLSLGLAHLHELPRDTTDRNRTSPIAFTGNKFEFRAVGASQSVGFPIVVLNAATAEGLRLLCGELSAALGGPGGRDEAILGVLRRSAARTKGVRFDGNCYTEAWRKEAGRRGLADLADTPAALEVLRAKDHVAFLARDGILSLAEVEGRRRVRLEHYIKVREIECACLDDLVRTQVLPALLSHRALVAGAEAAGRSRPKSALARHGAGLDRLIDELLEAADRLQAVRARAADEEHEEERARILAATAVPGLEELRALCDRAELQVADGLWALPKYRELLFLA